MKRVALIGLAIGLGSLAHADVLFNNLNGTFGESRFDTDGGTVGMGSNYGGQVGQVITNTNDTAITGIAANYEGHTTGSGTTAAFAEVFNFSNGMVGSLVGSQTVINFSEQDTSGGLENYNTYTVSANVDLKGLQAGSQYLVVLQLQATNADYLGISTNGKADTYVESFSNFGYTGAYNTSGWEELGAYSGTSSESGDATMEVIGAPAPEPASMVVLGLSLIGLARKHRR